MRLEIDEKPGATKKLGTETIHSSTRKRITSSKQKENFVGTD